ncbi:efflux RND transporter permease subunit, partial [Rhizobium ruizarguesonis]
VENEVIDRLASVDGVADVEEYGDKEKVFRVDVEQGALASRGLTIGDLTKALDNAALDVAEPNAILQDDIGKIRRRLQVGGGAHYDILRIALQRAGRHVE